MRKPERRDELRDKYDLIGLEMEAAGIMNTLPTGVIRGVCDYGDSQKNKDWQPYAAAVAAVYAKGILNTITPKAAEVQTTIARSNFPEESKMHHHEIGGEPIPLRPNRLDGLHTTISEGSAPKYLDLDILAKWLRPNEDHLTTHMLIRGKRVHAEAGQWVFKDPKFREWQKTPGSRLWLHGKVGSGKTILCSSIIESLKAKERDASVETHPVMFFYFAFNKSDEQNLEFFFTSILYQFCASQGIPKRLQSLYSRYRKLSKGRPTVPAPPKSDLLQVLLDTCQSLPNGGFLVMDAMDEIPHGLQREDFLRLLRQIASVQTSKLNILVTSQSEPDFTNQFRWDLGWYILGLGRSRVDVDIALFVHYELSTATKFSRLSSHERSRIEDYLVTKANGVFQWVDLILQMLQIPMVLRPHEIEEILRSLPKDLKETYDRLLQRVDESVAQEVSVALKWLSLAKRPLYIEEVIEASILDPRSSITLNAERRLNATQLLSCLTGLVTLEPPLSSDTTVQTETHILALAHSSIRGYLILKNNDPHEFKHYQFDKDLTDEFIARCCVEYISHCYFVSWRKKFYPLAKYSDRFWIQHAEHNPQLLSDLRSRINEILRPILYPKDGAAPMLLEDNPDQSEDNFANNSEDLVHPPLDTPHGGDLSTVNQVLYTTLNASRLEFRLLILLPSRFWDDPLECRLQVVSMQDKPCYRAISYVWGDSQHKETIFVDGVPVSGPMNIQHGLRQIRHASGNAPQILWVDSICINQHDVADKSYQVSMMSSIFENASKVTIWLGTEAASSELAMAFLAKFQDIPDSTESVVNGLMSMSPSVWQALQDLFQRGWFERVWVVPEAVVAKTVDVMCGEWYFPWSVLERIERAYATHGRELHEYTFGLLHAPAYAYGPSSDRSDSPSRTEFSQYILGSRTLTTLLAIRRRYHCGRPFKAPELIVLMRDHKCVEPRDRIFSLHMMSKAGYGLGHPSPNYTQSLQQVFSEYTEYWLRASGELDLLSCVDSSSIPGISDLPGWVPDWNGRLVLSLDQGDLARPFKEHQPRLYNATLSSAASLTYSDMDRQGHRTIKLSGIHVGVVARVGQPVTPKVFETGGKPATSKFEALLRSPMSWLFHAREPEEILKSTAEDMKREVISKWRHLMDTPSVTRHYGVKALDDTFWRTFCADQELTPFGDPRRLSKRQQLRPSDADQLVADWVAASPTYLQNRTFFTAVEGLVGLCPRHAQSGDRIVLLQGGRLPFIIRKEGFGDKYYKLIGEAYVHSIMDGELFGTRNRLQRMLRKIGTDVDIWLV